MSDPPATLAELVRERRLEMGITQTELADRIGLGMLQRDVSYLELGKIRTPAPARIERLAEVLGIDRGTLWAACGFTDFDRYGKKLDPELLAAWRGLSGDRRTLMEIAAELSDAGVRYVLSIVRFVQNDEQTRGVLPDTGQESA